MAEFILVEYVEHEKSYFAEWFSGLEIILLLGRGTKRGQSRDIRKAIDRWTTYRERKTKR